MSPTSCPNESGLSLVNGVPFFEVFGAKIHCATIEEHGKAGVTRT